MNEELMNFVKWLPEHVELFKGLTTEETVSKINNLSASEEGKETLEQLTKQYKNTEMGIFKEGGKLHQLLCFKTGGKGPDCGCNKVTKHQETSILPKYAKIVEQGWGKPRYTFMSDHNPSDPKSPLNTVTPDNIWNGGYDGMWVAREYVQNPQDSVNFGAIKRYGQPEIDIMVNQASEAGPVYVPEMAPINNWEAAWKELLQKQNKIRNKK